MKKRLTKLDFWVLAVVLALVAGVFFKGRAVRRLPESHPFTYQMEVSGLEGEIVPGDNVLCHRGKQSVGIVTEVRTEDDRLVLTLEAEGYPIEGGIRTDIYDILPGFQEAYFTEAASWEGTILSVSEVIS